MDITKVFNETYQTSPVDFNLDKDFFFYFQVSQIAAATGIESSELQSLIDTHQIDTDLDQSSNVIIHERELNRMAGMVDDDRLKAFNRFISDVNAKCSDSQRNAIQTFFQTLEASK